MHYFSGGAFESLISSQLLKKEIYILYIYDHINFQTVQFPSTYTVISGLLYVVDNSKQQIFDLCRCCSKQTTFSAAHVLIRHSLSRWQLARMFFVVLYDKFWNDEHHWTLFLCSLTSINFPKNQSFPANIIVFTRLKPFVGCRNVDSYFSWDRQRKCFSMVLLFQITKSF